MKLPVALLAPMLTALAGALLSAQTSKPSPIHYRARVVQRLKPAAAVPARSKSPDPVKLAAVAGTEESGVASFSGASSNGNVMSNGERFDSDQLIAAHRSLPFGARVQVTNAATGRSVVVTITDRSAASGGHVISVSSRAAEQLGFVKEGKAQVRLRVLRVDEKL